MTDILLCGKSTDQSIVRALLPALARYGGVRYVHPDLLRKIGEDEPRFLVCDCERIPKVEGHSGILFFKNSFDSDSPISIPDGFLCAFEPQNQRAAALLRAAGAAAVTCGMCAKDTLSISSLDYGAAALSLQRSITTLDGDVVEPRDITVELHSTVSPRQMLAVCMVLLMAGVDSSRGYVI